MLTRWSDIDRDFPIFDDLERRMARLFQDYDPRPAPGPSSHEKVWPRVSLFDVGDNFLLRAEVPGLDAPQVKISVQEDVLSIEGERKNDAPEGFTTHRRERSPVRFSRSFTLPSRVDPEKSTASVKDGVLTISLAKAADAKPRQIAVRPS